MKSIKILSAIIFVFTVSFMFTGCTKHPTSCFTVSNSNPSVNQVVNFTNCSTDGKKFHWDFGDGTSADGDTGISHAYSAQGSYTVTLSANSSNGKNNDSKQVITVN